MWEVLTGFDPALLAAFVAAGLVLNLTPGADFFFVSASGIAGGPRAGIAAAVGVNLGIALHVAMAAAGVSALLIASPALFDAIRYCGAAYLLWLAVGAWRASRAAGPETSAAPRSPWRAVRRGVLTNVLNPKTTLFIFAFIPQFADPAIGPVGVQIAILGAIFLVVGFAFSLCLGLAAGALADRLAARLRGLRRLSAVVFGGLAARLVLE